MSHLSPTPQPLIPQCASTEISIELSWEEVRPAIAKYFVFKEEDTGTGFMV